MQVLEAACPHSHTRSGLYRSQRPEGAEVEEQMQQLHMAELRCEDPPKLQPLHGLLVAEPHVRVVDSSGDDEKIDSYQQSCHPRCGGLLYDLHKDTRNWCIMK